MALKSHDSILGVLYFINFYLLISICFFTTTLVLPYEDEHSFTISRFTYSKTSLRPYDWRYIRVDLPTSFSSVTIALESDVNPDKRFARKANSYNLPIICVCEGSPPLPDAYNTSLTGLCKTCWILYLMNLWVHKAFNLPISVILCRKIFF